jgi:hypothetical protein
MERALRLWFVGQQQGNMSLLLGLQQGNVSLLLGLQQGNMGLVWDCSRAISALWDCSRGMSPTELLC